MRFLYSLIFLSIFSISTFGYEVIYPAIDGDWWQVASTPDIGEYNSDGQQPVDFGIWQAKDGSWQIWSCIRFANVPGHTRLFYRWEGKNISDTHWQPMGIAMMSSPEYSEPLNGLQAPHVVQYKGKYWMAYGDWDNICFATSKEGKTFTHLINKERTNKTAAVFSEGPVVNTRDAMLLFTKDKWHCYYTAFPVDQGYVYCRTSDNLTDWSDSFTVAYGGLAGNGRYSCECPFVVEAFPGSYILFRTQYYGPGAQTSVYFSKTPYNFGIDDDSHYVTKLNVCAPEIVKVKDQYYIAALNPNLDGIRIARIKFTRFSIPVLDFVSGEARKSWKITSGNLASVFTNSARALFHAPNEYFIATSEDGGQEPNDAQKGVIESAEFKITQPQAVVLISRSKDLENAYISIVDSQTGREYNRFTGDNKNVFRPIFIDCSAFMNKSIKIKAVDSSDKPWGHINFAGIYLPDSIK